MIDIRVYILDDDADAISRLEFLLGTIRGVKICGSESNPFKAIPIIKTQKPDLIFLDIEMPGLSGFDVLKGIKTKSYNPTIIFITGWDKYAIKAIKESAFDYLLKPVDHQELACTIKRYTDHLIPLTAEILVPLTKREKEIFELLRVGRSSKQIAEALHISKNTVDTHRRTILKKLDLSSTTEIHLRFHHSLDVSQG